MFVERAKHGRRPVIAAWTERQYQTQLELPDNDPAVMAYLTQSPLATKLAGLGLTINDIVQAATRLGRFIDRDGEGFVKAAWSTPQRDGHEMVPPDHPDLQRFLEGGDIPVAPNGYKFEFMANTKRWRIIRLADRSVWADGLESASACAERLAARNRII